MRPEEIKKRDLKELREIIESHDLRNLEDLCVRVYFHRYFKKLEDELTEEEKETLEEMLKEIS